jgi:hypothetical protein
MEREAADFRLKGLVRPVGPGLQAVQKVVWFRK